MISLFVKCVVLFDFSKMFWRNAYDNKSPPKKNSIFSTLDFDSSSQIKYEDEYSQINPYEDF